MTFINERKIVEFFRQPRGFRKPTKEERAGVVATHGVYAWYSDLLLAKQAKPNVPVNGHWRIDDFLLLYIGIVTQRPIKKRLYYASGRGRADQHLVPMGLGCLLSNTLGIELRQGKQPGFLVFVPREPLQNWIADHVCFKYLETKEAKALEPMLITELRPLLNLEYNEQHPFYTVIKNTIDLHKSQAKTFPRVEG